MDKIKIAFFFLSFSLSVCSYSQLERFIERRDNHTHALVVSKKGKIILEKYYEPWAPKKKHHSWSMAKLFGALVFLKAQEQGLVTLDTPLAPLFQKDFPYCSQDKRKKELTFRHALTFSTGLHFSEAYAENPFYSHVTAMLYGESRRQMANYVWCMPMSQKPGTDFSYSSGDSNLLQGALHRLLKDKYENYPWETIFNPMGINVTWEVDDEGNLLGSSYVYMTARDYLAVGEMIRLGGLHRGKRIFSESSMALASTQAKVFQEDFTFEKMSKVTSGADAMTYGHGLWFNASAPQGRHKKAYPVSEKLIMAIGYEGNYLLIFPEDDAVVLRLAADYGKESLSREDFLVEAEKFVKEAVVP
jgi:CubicO group peptidase (beta-lactamase class C family)